MQRKILSVAIAVMLSLTVLCMLSYDHVDSDADGVTEFPLANMGMRILYDDFSTDDSNDPRYQGYEMCLSMADMAIFSGGSCTNNVASVSGFQEALMENQEADDCYKEDLRTLLIMNGSLSCSFVPGSSGALFNFYPGSSDLSALYTALGHSTNAEVEQIVAVVQFDVLMNYRNYVEFEKVPVVNHGDNVWIWINSEIINEMVVSVEGQLNITFTDSTTKNVSFRSEMTTVQRDVSGGNQLTENIRMDSAVTLGFNEASYSLTSNNENQVTNGFQGESVIYPLTEFPTDPTNGILEITKADYFKDLFDNALLDPADYDYTLKYMDGNDCLYEETYNYGDTITLPEPPTKSGYSFLGWDGYTEGMKMPACDLVFRAQWSGQSAAEYTVYYQDNQTAPYATQTYKEGELIILPEPPTKSGYSFAGWQGYDDGMVMPATDLYFTALWNWAATNDQHTVTYTVDGAQYQQQVYSIGDTIVLPDAPTKSGSTFMFWSGYTDGMTVGGSDIVLKAVWSKQFTAEDLVENNGSIDISVDSEGVSMNGTTVNEVISRAESSNSNINLKVSDASISLSPEAMKRLSTDSDGNVKELNVSVVKDSKLDDRLAEKVKGYGMDVDNIAMVISIDINGAGRTDDLGNVQVTVPFTGADTGKDYVVYFVDDNGNYVLMRESKLSYDADGNPMMTFTTNHFSCYVVMPAEGDISDDVVTVCAAVIGAFCVLTLAAFIIRK